MAQRRGSPGWRKRVVAKGLAWLARAAGKGRRMGAVSAMGYETAKSVDADSFGDSKDGYSPMTEARIVAGSRLSSQGAARYSRP